MFEYVAVVLRVVDGDTVDLDFDLGLRIHTRARCRLSGLDAPERGTVAGRDATAFLVALLPPGTHVVASTYRDRTEKYGRWLVQLYRGDVDVNAALVAGGHAVPWSAHRVRSHPSVRSAAT